MEHEGSPVEHRRSDKDRKERRRRRDDEHVHKRYWDNDWSHEKRTDRSPDDQEERHKRRRRERSPGECEDRNRRERSPHMTERHRRDRNSPFSRSDRRNRKRTKSSPSEMPEEGEIPDGAKKDEKNKIQDEELGNITRAQKRTVDLLTSKTGGAYIPPAKLKLMQAEITDKSSAAYQRIAWEALKKSIHGHINKVNTSNIGLITRELLRENVIRGRGLLARSIIQAQVASPTFTPIYAALTAILNSKFPNIGELIIHRLVKQFIRGYKTNNKSLCISSGSFIAHLINQRVVHEIIVLELWHVLLKNPTDDSVEVAIALLKECGQKLTEVSKAGIVEIFDLLRNILHEGKLDKRIQYMIEVMFQIRKDGFKDHVAVPKELDLVEENDQIIHVIQLQDKHDSEDILNVFRFDSEYIRNEEKYKELQKEILGSDNSDASGEDEDSSEEDDSGDEEDAEKKDVILDNTETNLKALRRTIYLTIHSSLDFEECAHKLMKMQLKPGQERELCYMFLDCCKENRTYEKFYGLLAGRFCAINKIYVTPFEEIFKESYDTIHRLDMNKLRNVAKFFAHLLITDSISWVVLSCIKLNEEDTTPSSRVFIKILFQELSEYMGVPKLNNRIKDVTLQEAFEGLFPRDTDKKTRFAVNFFTTIGLGGLTDDLREHLKSRPKVLAAPPPEILETLKTPR
ncbi:hypothetical protein KQX54_008517 [Cotesia glomerata]|uniref:MI domain-containing protein n=1 Tax=Cotesia glomerata TaxID=32391 RepID=A0AAV7IZY0_COTGL|nr:hypothetical protein KQX54_008517 [Cotesia glomerata]